VNGEIRGGFTTDAKSKINPSTPRLSDLTWARARTDKNAPLESVPRLLINKSLPLTRETSATLQAILDYIDSSAPPQDTPNANQPPAPEASGPAVDDNERDVKIRQAFGKESEESKRKSKVYLASKGAVFAIDNYDLVKDSVVVKITPFSLGLFIKKQGAPHFPEIITVQCGEAYVRLDRPIASLADLSRSKVV